MFKCNIPNSLLLLLVSICVQLCKSCSLTILEHFQSFTSAFPARLVSDPHYLLTKQNSINSSSGKAESAGT